MTKWKSDIYSFGSDRPDFGGETIEIRDRLYSIGIWASQIRPGRYEVALLRVGEAHEKGNKLIRGKTAVKLEVAQKWYKIYKKNINKYIK